MMKFPNFKMDTSVATAVWASVVKETKFGATWLWARGLINQGPFLALSIVGGGNFLTNIKLLVFNIGMWILFEYSLRESLRFSKIARKNKNLLNISMEKRLINFSILGYRESAIFFFTFVILVICELDISKIFRILISSISAILIILPIIALASELMNRLASIFWDIKFIMPFILRVIQFTAPILLISRNDSIHQMINPLSFPFTVVAHFGFNEGHVQGVFSYSIFLIISSIMIVISKKGAK